MSIMSVELPTTAKCVINTTKGKLEIELWAKECPVTTRSFLQAGIDGLLNEKSLIKLSGKTVELDYGELNCEEEFHHKLRFTRRGLVGIIPEDSMIFFTLDEKPELNDKAVLFGTLVGESIYNLVGISEGELEEDSKTFMYPAKIQSVEITIPYFKDLRRSKRRAENPTTLQPIKKDRKTAVIHFLDDEMDDEEVPINFKMKAAHDVLQDDKLVDGVREISETPAKLSSGMETESNKAENKTDQLPPPDNIDEPVTDRERDTLAFLGSFLSNRKAKSPVFN
ncbi:HDR050Wp [Eremothecium sinecaudum]|uniref:HDR050Wp n=1 Tax=Eremothecium sinecaudum TaxID=45286 RepID=A0A109UX49_9SACH|nr:HDR050Wp [Eremothecium sinecaudum]AMD20792.1 HDR050Wp [Eremothecium sinecaudum]